MAKIGEVIVAELDIFIAQFLICAAFRNEITERCKRVYGRVQHLHAAGEFILIMLKYIVSVDAADIEIAGYVQDVRQQGKEKQTAGDA